MFAGITDPVSQGFVKSLARPQSNVTGFAAYEVSLRKASEIVILTLRTLQACRVAMEPAEAAAGAAAQSAKVVNGSWSDDDPTGLELHEPEATDIVITFESRH